MKQVRLLPIVLFATASLLVLKVLGLSTGTGSFAVGPSPAIAAGDDAATLMAPVDLAREAEMMRRAAEEAAGTEPPPSAEDPAAPPSDGEPDASAPPADGTGADAETAGAPAPAEEPAPAPAADPAAAAPASDLTSPAGAPVTTVRPDEFVPPVNNSEAAVLKSLSDRRSELDRREEEIQLRMKLLEAAEAKLQQRVDELKNIETQLGGAVEENRKKDQENLKGLVSMYENMKPKAAAEVFNNLDMPVLLSLVEVMNPRKMAGILAVMDPQKAGQLTVALAGDIGPAKVVISREIGGEAGFAPEAPVAERELPKIQPAPAN